MGNPRAQLAADAEEAADLVQETVDHSAGIDARAGMNGNAGRLVDHDEMRIVVQDWQIQLFRDQLRWSRWSKAHLDLRAFAWADRGLRRLPSEGDRARIDELAYP